MGFVRFDEMGRLLDAKGTPTHMVGINYVTSYICTNFWEDWRPEHIEKDLARIHELGLQAVRIPMHWGFMEPEPGKYNTVFEERFRIFVELCKKYDLYIMPWFLVGIATREYDVPFRNGRSFLTGEMVQIEEKHLQHFIAPYREEEQILFWDICDEPEWYSRFCNADPLPYKRTESARWVKTMYDAIRSVDTNHLITLGFGHIATANYGMDVRDMAQILDLMVVTAYPDSANEGIDSARNNYCIPFHVKMNARGKPTFTCEAPGYSSIAYSESIVGRFFKTSLYGNLLAGSTGVLPWVYTDFDESLWHETPLEGYTIEPNFGIVTVDGRLKPSGAVLRDYAAFARKAELGFYRPQKARVAIVVPEGYYAGLMGSKEKIYTAMAMVKGCGVDADLVWTSESFDAYQLLILPSCAGMTTSAWDKVRRFVEAGGVLYHLFDDGRNGYFNRLFGVEVQTTEMDPGYSGMTLTRDWGKWTKGQTVTFSGNGRDSLMRVVPTEAEVIAVFEEGEPALLKNSYGQGAAYYSVTPLYSGLMRIPCQKYLESSCFAIMEALIREAGIKRLAVCEHPAMEIGCLERPDTGEMLLLCVNHHNRPVQTELAFDENQIPAGWTIRRFEDGEVVQEKDLLDLEPAGVTVYRIAP